MNPIHALDVHAVFLCASEDEARQLAEAIRRFAATIQAPGLMSANLAEVRPVAQQEDIPPPHSRPDQRLN